MKIIFFGTPQFVTPVLSALNKTYNKNQAEPDLVGVVTQPPKETGRKKVITRSAVDNWAFKHKIPVFYDLSEIPQADLGILAAYGEILPIKVIKKFPLGILNIHPSLLPSLRGASPIQASIALGDIQTGVSVIKMDEAMDHGPIISQFRDEVRESDTAESLRARLFERSAQFLIELIPNYVVGKIKKREQDHKMATFTKLIQKQDGFVPEKIFASALSGKKSQQAWNPNFLQGEKVESSANGICRMLLALSPWPGIWTLVNNKRLKILKAHVGKNKELVIETVQLEGKNPVSWKQFCEAYKFEI